MTRFYKVRHGGLMRCCLQSLDDHMLTLDKLPEEGATFRCTYCQDASGMAFRAGAWEWAKPVSEQQADRSGA